MFRVARQMVRQNRAVIGSGCVKDIEGKVVTEEEKVLDTGKHIMTSCK